MGIKETLTAVLAALGNIDVTNQDGNAAKMYARIFNEQPQREIDGTGMAYPKPATFLQVELGEGVPCGMGATQYEIKLTTLTVHENYNNPDTSDDQDLSIFDIKDSVHRVMNNTKFPNCSPLFSTGNKLDYNHGDIYMFTNEYASCFVDLTGSIYDDLTGQYITQTLVNPILQIQENIYYGIYPATPLPPTATVGGSIVFGYGVGYNQWLTGSGVPSNTIGNNGDYYRNDVNGDIYYKSGGVFALVGNIIGGGGGGSITRVVVTNGAYTVPYINGTNYVIFSTNGDAVILPDVTIQNGESYKIKNLDIAGGVCYISEINGALIDGVFQYDLTTMYEAVELISDGTNYNIF